MGTIIKKSSYSTWLKAGIIVLYISVSALIIDLFVISSFALVSILTQTVYKVIAIFLLLILLSNILAKFTRRCINLF